MFAEAVHWSPGGNSSSVDASSWLWSTAWSGDQLFFSPGARSTGCRSPALPLDAFVLPFYQWARSYHLLWWVVLIFWEGRGFRFGLVVHGEDSRKFSGHTTVFRLWERKQEQIKPRQVRFRICWDVWVLWFSSHKFVKIWFPLIWKQWSFTWEKKRPT